MNISMTKPNKPQMHHFDVEDAIKYGVEKAVVLSNIRFWLNNNKNKDLSAVKHDGYYWMYNTAKDMSNVLPYFTQSKVQRLLKQLEDDGVLIVGNYNKVKYDRTKWYTLSEFTYDENCSTQTPELNIGIEDIEQPIQDSKTNTKTNNKEKIKLEIENLNAEYKVLISQKIKDLTNTTNEYQREMIENTYKELEKDKTNRIEQLQKLLEQQQEDLDTEKIKRLKTAIKYFDDILKSNEPNRYILECLIDKIWIYHDKSVKFELKPEISRLI